MSGTMAVGTLVGRLTRDAELKYTTAGLAIASFAVATDTRVKKGDQWVDEPSYWDVSMFGKSAENLNQYLTKGKLVSVFGEIRIETWEKDGVRHSKVKMSANSLTLLGSKEGQSEAQRGRDEGRPTRSASNAAEGWGDGYADGIPF
jgi:single-strand DNA-binding protein